MTQTITLRRPDDWHLHVRDEEVMSAVVPHTSAHFARAIIMPNLVPPVTTWQMAGQYRDRIKRSVPAEHTFEPLMTLYLTETIDAENLREGHGNGNLTAAKLYPAGATTNSDAGVKDVSKIYPVFEVMQEIGMPLLVHGEVVDADVDIFDRETIFIERVLSGVVERFPELPVVFEHITTSDGIEFVKTASENVAATITPHHLVINRNDLFSGGLRPHYYCLPVAKRETHRAALVKAATSGSPKFFLGTDSAPHTISSKESDCGCAGIFNAGVAMPILAHVFETANALESLEGFCSLHGPAFYKLAPNEAQITLERRGEPVVIDAHINAGDEQVRIFDPGFDLHWVVQD